MFKNVGEVRHFFLSNFINRVKIYILELYYKLFIYIYKLDNYHNNYKLDYIIKYAFKMKTLFPFFHQFFRIIL